MSNRAIMEFGKMLTKSENIFTAGAGGPIFAWAAPGDIVICGKAPEDFDGRVCSVKFPDEETSLFCRLYRDGENVRVGFMDDYDVWKSYPADAVTEHSKPKSYHIHNLPLCIIISEIGVVPCPLYTINSALRQGVKGKGKGTTGGGSLPAAPHRKWRMALYL